MSIIYTQEDALKARDLEIITGKPHKPLNRVRRPEDDFNGAMGVIKEYSTPIIDTRNFKWCESCSWGRASTGEIITEKGTLPGTELKLDKNNNVINPEDW